MIQLQFFACGYPVELSLFAEETMFSPLVGLGIIVKNQLTKPLSFEAVVI